MANPNVQKVPKLLLQLNEWQAQGRLDKAHGQTLNGQDAVQTERTDAGRDTVDVTERKRRGRCWSTEVDPIRSDPIDPIRSVDDVVAVPPPSALRCPLCPPRRIHLCCACVLTSLCAALPVCPAVRASVCAGLTLSYNAAVLALADEIGTTPDVSAQQREGRNKMQCNGMRCGPMECAHSPDRSESDRTERPSNGRRAEGSAVFVVVRIGAAC